jgi:tetratricopeptide (TPR) repeat protein
VPVYRQDLARARHGLAVVWRKTNRNARAEQAGTEAIALLRALAAEHPDEPDFRRDLAVACYDQGALLARLGGRQREAEKVYRESLQQQEELARRFPGQASYRRDLARTLNNLGKLLGRAEHAEAEASISRAVKLQQKLVKEHPAVAVYRLELARSWVNLGTRQWARSPDEADRSYLQARDLLAGLRADFPTVPVYQQELAAVHSNRGLLLQQQKRWDEAEKAFDEALALRRRLVELPDDRHKLADTLLKKGYLLNWTNRPRQAEPLYREALAIQSKLVAGYPRVPAYRNARGQTLNLLTGLLVERGGFSEKEQVAGLVGRAAWGPALPALGPVLQAQAALREARSCLELAIADHGTALETDRKNEAYRERLRSDHLLQAVVLLRLGEPAAAAAQAEKLTGLFPSSATDHVLAARLLAESASRPGPGQERRARRAVELLEKAVKLGFRDARQLSTWPVYAPLRDRDDFQKLLARLSPQAPARGPPGP